MLISEDLLLKYGASYEFFDINQIIFSEGYAPKFYYQISTGSVELNNYHEDGKEFTHDIFSDGQSIGTFFLFNDRPYSVTAVAVSKCKILKISKSDFTILLAQNPEITSKIFKSLADHLSDKYSMLFNLVTQDPELKIESIINYFKGSGNFQPYSFQLPLTRQQLANLTGLRVETVIRTIKKMENANKLMIRNRRVYC